MIWSPQQQSVFDWCTAPTGNLVVVARAGTGKTTTIVEGIKHIAFAPDERALFCAYNKRIQQELASRITSEQVDVKTFHALGLMFLKDAWGNVELSNDIENERIRAAVGDKPNWEVVAALKKLIGIAKGVAPFGNAGLIADLAVSYGCEVDEWHRFDAKRMGEAARACMDMAQQCDPATRITFDDMLFVPVVNKYVLGMYNWVFVDEAQDTNTAQLLLAQAALKPGGHMVVVGDDRQAMYAFRGADSRAIERLKVELAAEERRLTVTYRCPKKVVQLAQGLVTDIEAAPDAPEGVVEAMRISDMLDAVDLGDVILSRVNAPLVPLCLSLIRRGISARIEGRDIGQLLAKRAKKLRADTVEEFLQKLGKWADRSRRLAIAHGRCVEQKVQETTDIEETLAAMAEGCTTPQAIITRCEGMFKDTEGDRSGLVVLSSIHKAKGLEWPRVFLLTDSLYCYGKRRGDREEENIHYVAITRAKRTLVLVGAGAPEKEERPPIDSDEVALRKEWT